MMLTAENERKTVELSDSAGEIISSEAEAIATIKTNGYDEVYMKNEKVRWDTAMPFYEYIKSAKGIHMKEIQIAIFPGDFFKDPLGKTFPEELEPRFLEGEFEKLSIFEFVQFAIQFKNERKLKRNSIYVPIGTKTESDLFPVCFDSSFFQKRVILQCSKCPTLQFHSRKRFFVLKLR
jgi:hypothetical protein